MFSNKISISSIYDSFTNFMIKPVIANLSENMKRNQSLSLKSRCENMPKLRTFIKFKDFSDITAHILKPLSFPQRRAISKLRLGVLNIRIESGRIERPRLLESERSCNVCLKMFSSVNYSNSNTLTHEYLPVENEKHYLFFCLGYCDLRFKWLNSLCQPDNFNFISTDEKLKIVLNQHENVKLTAQFILDAWDRRSKLLFD